MPLEDLEAGMGGMAAGMMDPGVTELGKEVMTFMARPPSPLAHDHAPRST